MTWTLRAALHYSLCRRHHRRVGLIINSSSPRELPCTKTVNSAGSNIHVRPLDVGWEPKLSRDHNDEVRGQDQGYNVCSGQSAPGISMQAVPPRSGERLAVLRWLRRRRCHRRRPDAPGFPATGHINSYPEAKNRSARVLVSVPVSEGLWRLHSYAVQVHAVSGHVMGTTLLAAVRSCDCITSYTSSRALSEQNMVGWKRFRPLHSTWVSRRLRSVGPAQHRPPLS